MDISINDFGKIVKDSYSRLSATYKRLFVYVDKLDKWFPAVMKRGYKDFYNKPHYYNPDFCPICGHRHGIKDTCNPGLDIQEAGCDPEFLHMMHLVDSTFNDKIILIPEGEFRECWKRAIRISDFMEASEQEQSN